MPWGDTADLLKNVVSTPFRPKTDCQKPGGGARQTPPKIRRGAEMRGSWDQARGAEIAAERGAEEVWVCGLVSAARGGRPSAGPRAAWNAHQSTLLPCALCRIPVFQAGGRRPAMGWLAARAADCGSSLSKAANTSPLRSASFPILAGGRPPTMRTSTFLPRRGASGAASLNNRSRVQSGCLRSRACQQSGGRRLRPADLGCYRIRAAIDILRPGRTARQQVATGPASASGLPAW